VIVLGGTIRRWEALRVVDLATKTLPSGAVESTPTWRMGHDDLSTLDRGEARVPKQCRQALPKHSRVPSNGRSSNDRAGCGHCSCHNVGNQLVQFSVEMGSLQLTGGFQAVDARSCYWGPCSKFINWSVSTCLESLISQCVPSPNTFQFSDSAQGAFPLLFAVNSCATSPHIGCQESQRGRERCHIDWL